MSNVFNIQSTTVTSNTRSSTRQNRIATATLWTIQAILAALFLFAGAMKLITPVEVMAAQMAVPMPGWFLLFIGIAECAGALGLILPQMTHIKPVLTPLAASGLAIIMAGATVVTLIGGGGAMALYPLVVGVLLAIVVYGRRSFFKTV